MPDQSVVDELSLSHDMLTNRLRQHQTDSRGGTRSDPGSAQPGAAGDPLLGTGIPANGGSGGIRTHASEQTGETESRWSRASR